MHARRRFFGCTRVICGRKGSDAPGPESAPAGRETIDRHAGESDADGRSSRRGKPQTLTPKPLTLNPKQWVNFPLFTPESKNAGEQIHAGEQMQNTRKEDRHSKP